MKKLSLLFLSLFIIGLLGTTASVAATIYSAGNLTGGSVTKAGVRTGGGLWTATTTWNGGVVPLSTDDVVIVSGDLVYNSASTSVASLTIQNNAIFCQGAGFTGTGTFTMSSGSWWYGAYGSATKIPGGFATYSIDAASNWVICSNASSTLINGIPAVYGNLIVYKGGSILVGATGLTSNLAGVQINIQGNLTIDDGSATSAVKGANTKSDASNTIHIGGNVTIISGILTGVDAVIQNTSCTYNIDGSVFVGDASTASGVAALAGVSSPDAGLLRTATYNITGDLRFIKGAKFEAGTTTGSTNTSESVNINLQGNLTTDATVAVANNTVGTFVFSFVGTGAQTMTLGVPLAFSPATLFTLKINKSSNSVTLNSAASITGILNLTSGTVTLGTNNLTVTGSISGGSTSTYIVTNGSGGLIQNVPTSTNVTFPVGTGTYNPVVLNTSGSADNFTVRVTSTSNVDAVMKEWTITEASKIATAAVTLQWNTATDEDASFVRASAIVSQWNGAAWDWSKPISVTDAGGGAYTASASGFSFAAATPSL